MCCIKDASHHSTTCAPPCHRRRHPRCRQALAERDSKSVGEVIVAGATGVGARVARSANRAQRRAAPAEPPWRDPGDRNWSASCATNCRDRGVFAGRQRPDRLVDPAHVQHDQAHDWSRQGRAQRIFHLPAHRERPRPIVGHPKYPNSPGPPNVVCRWPRFAAWRPQVLARPPQHRRCEVLHLNCSAATRGSRTATCSRWSMPTEGAWQRWTRNWPPRSCPAGKKALELIDAR